MDLNTDLVQELLGALPYEGGVLTDPDLLRSYEHDEADLVPYGTPSVVVRPRTTGQVSAVLRAASRHKIPVIPQGARSGLAGGANAIEGAIVLSLTGMNEIIDIDTANRIAVVQPGVVNAQLRRAVAAEGLYYPPDPGSWEQSTIGGNVSTDAGGMCCVKYGVTSDHVIGLEVVLASGEVLNCGRRTAKGVAGYDLTSLFVGSEGTLGVITEITVKLRPAPEPALTLVAVFDTLAAAGAAVSAVVGSGMQPSMLEVIDRVALTAIEAYRPMDLPTTAAALLIASVDSGGRAPDDLARIAAMCRTAQASDVYVASDEAEADALLAARRLAHPALEHFAAQLFPGGGGIMVDDVAVPRTRLVELIEGIEGISAEHGVVVATVGHAGDGNLHPVIVIDRSDPVNLAQGQKVFDAIMSLGLSLGGTSTGEHGVGLLKRDWLAREIGPTGLKAHRSIKAALDPDNILNPGKVF
ncbi:FAD-linked oxidase C-terminal domain-containing protein [Dactylosporangium fulvum]|uniref:FAD-binding protein n=1 Tax=Dactylosporangium fulvum TaxID=53359 RepID=A0ABY5W2R9_9ACTN|nr:FAD-linked oxidase C-terminal domain-containing protein [Dactylosporangium fulvum]UWP83354.1 FAD-binding protein [Dactylosporangium fulvum]